MEYRRIVIGDVHGHYDGLMLLLEALAPSSKDRIYFLGDLIDRGPKSAQVLDFVQHSPYQTLLGNHEQLMLEALSGSHVDMRAWQSWLCSGGDATVASYRDTGMMPYKHLDWLRSLPTYIDLGDIWLVHAGVHPAMPISEQSSEQLCWIRKEFHTISKPYFPNKLIITGHTITFTFEGVRPGELVRGQGWLDIDTGAYHPKSGWLTAFDLNYRRVYQVNVFNNQVRIVPFDEVVRQLYPQISRPKTPISPVVQHQG
ncbi:metallophosphoesterase family protein [Tychonema sp. LEGE 07203]|uniref:metallophosphoesterase family protein n=1 Tax=Tychonema sp. LEGE 07203 TaxID=1828671 RepID=UPI001881CBB0|nr:serine/threonine protein phosphatase [Tychonema sp. LEGE 07203]